MNNSSSVGDLSRYSYLRQANASLKSRLAILTEEVTTGLKHEIPRATHGNLGHLAQIENGLAVLGAYRQNTTLLQSELGGLQSALGALSDLARARGPELQTAPGLSDETTLDLRSRQSKEDFHAVVGLVNVDVGGRFMLSGTAVQTAPLDDPAAILQQAKLQIAAATSAGDIISTLDTWFDAPPGGGGFLDMHFRGNTDATTTAVSTHTTASHDLTAAHPSFRAILKGLALAALAGDPDLDLGHVEKSALVGSAGKHVMAAGDALIRARSRVGINEELTGRAATRNAAEHTALSTARTDILAADPYEAASALTQTEASLQSLYALTTRLSRLSLTDYLR